MTRCVLTPRAQRDLDEIWDYTISRWNVAQSERYIRQIQRSCELLCAEPLLGRACDDIRVGYRKQRSGSHFIFYRMVAGGIEVVRVLRQSMDFDLHL
jgi:toxin ParE1/3/4